MNTQNFPPIFLGRLSVRAFLAALLCLALFVSGCGKKSGGEVYSSDANGYICSKCNAKFFTSSKVFAEFCPACKAPDIRPLVAFVCPKDNSVTVSPRADSIACEKCKATVEISRFPQENELVAWGATKKTQQEVCKH